MISEKDRSEAVARLRLALSYMLDYEDWYKANDSLFKCGNAAYREIAAAVCKGRRQGSYFDTVKRIIELAERPKSVMESLGDLKFEGKMRRMRCLNCGAVHWELATKTVRFSHCPFCGSKVKLMRVGADRIVKCEGCGVSMPFLADDAAQALWNTRIDRDELLKIADELENKFFVVYDSHGEIDHADCFVERIMKAIGE